MTACFHLPSVRCEHCMTVGTIALHTWPPTVAATTGLPYAVTSPAPCDHCFCSERDGGGIYATGPMRPHVVCCRCGGLALAPEPPHDCRARTDARDADVVSSPHLCAP